MAEKTSEEAKVEQRLVQQLLGRCILRLQQYETLLKALLVSVEFSGQPRDLAASQTERKGRFGRKTLGTLVGEFVGTYMVVDPLQSASDRSVDLAGGPTTVSFQMSFQLSPDDHAETASSLKELVDLRNKLAHGFAGEHDLWTVEGCRRAQADLAKAHDRIDAHYARLFEIANVHDEVLQTFAGLIGSEAVRNLVVHGVAPDGTVDWPASSLASSFREAARALVVAEGEWVSVAEAGKWVAETHPGQSPERFGCKTWQQALQESRLFDLCRQVKGGRRVICFREKANPKVREAPERIWEFDATDASIQGPDR